MEHRHGLTIPLPGSLADQKDLISRLPEYGYTDVWSHEVDGADGFTPLVLASQWAPALRLGVAIIPAFTRTPALIAQQAAALADAAPGRFILGLGSSSSIIVEEWNGLPFEKPYQRVRDVIRFLRAAFAGEKVTHQYETFAVDGFRLSRVPDQPPPIYVAALRAGMLRLAGREGDGAILNFLSAADAARVIPHVHGEQPGAEIVARVFVLPLADPEAAREVGRRLLAAYLNVPVYAAFHEWLGRGGVLQAMWDAWAGGDRRTALAAIPDEVVDELIVHGSPPACRERIEAYHEAGVNTTAIAIPPLPGLDTEAVVAALGPA